MKNYFEIICVIQISTEQVPSIMMVDDARNKIIETVNSASTDFQINKVTIEDYYEIQACRQCGCTEDDCSQCIEAQGHPCHWIEEDLCSRCFNENNAAANNGK